IGNAALGVFFVHAWLYGPPVMRDDAALQGGASPRHGFGVLLTWGLARKAVVGDGRHGHADRGLHGPIGAGPFVLTVIGFQLRESWPETWVDVLFQHLHRGVHMGVHVDHLVAVLHVALLCPLAHLASCSRISSYETGTERPNVAHPECSDSLPGFTARRTTPPPRSRPSL